MKRILAAALSCVLLAGSAVGFAACTNEDDQLRDAADVTITFWNPITGPDAKYMQDLVSQFNTANEGSIYVEADADERILRRIVRDVKERGRDLDNIVEQYLTTVKPMHYLYVEPTRALADIVINSGMNDVAFDVVQSKIRLLLNHP